MEQRSGRRAVGLVVIVLLVAVLAAASPVSATPARPDTEQEAEDRFLLLLNQARAGQGLPPLTLDVRLSADARAWSTTMSAEDRLEHAPGARIASDTTRSVPGWLRAAENIGRGWDVEGLDAAFWNSPGHRANVVGDHDRVGIGVAYTPTRLWVTFRFAQTVKIAPPTSGTPDGDLWLADASGRVFTSGRARHHGDVSGARLNQPVVAMVSAAGKSGYWLLGQDGGVFSFGDARFHGSTGGLALNRPVNGMAVTPSGEGYWLVASDGGVFAFGDARFAGSTGGLALNRPVNGMAVTPSGQGYWLVASDGGLFAFGDAEFMGSAADGRLGAPVVGVAASPTGKGYWMVASNGRVAAFGDAVHHGDAGGRRLSAPIVRIQAAPRGGGYWLVATDGTVHPFGSAGNRVSGPLKASGIVAVAAAM